MPLEALCTCSPEQLHVPANMCKLNALEVIYSRSAGSQVAKP